MTEDHPVNPLGEYGLFQAQDRGGNWPAEEIWAPSAAGTSRSSARASSSAPGRLGILAKLFKLIDMNLPVPMIGSGKKPLSVRLRSSTARRQRGAAWKAGVPNEGPTTLGSLQTRRRVRKLPLGDLIGQRGFEIDPGATPGWARVKRTLRPHLDFLQHADHGPRAVSDRRRDVRCSTSPRASAKLGWVPQ